MIPPSPPHGMKLLCCTTVAQVLNLELLLRRVKCKAGEVRVVIASFSSDTSIDPCATFKRESGNWRIDQAAWGHPASTAQLVGPVAITPSLCVCVCMHVRLTESEMLFVKYKEGMKSGRWGASRFVVTQRRFAVPFF